MTCAEFQEQVMAYALGALSAEEARACEEHLRETTPHTGCAGALARARATVEAMDRGQAPVRPEVWQRIEAELTPGASGREGGRGRRLREAALWVALAASLFALTWTRMQTRVLRDGLHQANGQAERVAKLLEATKDAQAQCERDIGNQREWMALLEDPTTRVVSLRPVAGLPVKAVVLYNPRERRALVVSTAHAPAGKEMQVWVMHEGAATSAGLMRTHGNLSMGEVDPALLESAPEAFAVSLEPTGGSPKPTQMVLLGKLG